MNREGYEELWEKTMEFLGSDRDEDVIKLENPVTDEDVQEMIDLYQEHYENDDKPEFTLTAEVLNPTRVRVKCLASV